MAANSRACPLLAFAAGRITQLNRQIPDVNCRGHLRTSRMSAQDYIAKVTVASGTLS
jgi:hypothetical protein